MTAVADTSPLNYLVLIEHIDILPRLFGRIIVPAGVVRELQHPCTPAVVAAWAKDLPDWVTVVEATTTHPRGALGQGETEVLLLAQQTNVEVVLFDERLATGIARSIGIRSIGTLGALVLAADSGMLSLETAVSALLETNFRVSPNVLKHIVGSRKSPDGKGGETWPGTP